MNMKTIRFCKPKFFDLALLYVAICMLLITLGRAFFQRREADDSAIFASLMLAIFLLYNFNKRKEEAQERMAAHQFGGAAQSFLALTLGVDSADHLAEEAEEIEACDGRAVAQRWLWHQVIVSVVPLLLHRFACLFSIRKAFK